MPTRLLAYRVQGELSVDRLDAALTAIAGRHGGRSIPVRSRLHEASGTTEALAEARNEALADGDGASPALLRCSCHALAPADTLVCLVLPETLTDPGSLAVLFSELHDRYSTGAQQPIGVSAGYARRGERRIRWQQTPDAEGQRRYWRRRLSGALGPVSLGRAHRSAGPGPAAAERFHWRPELVAAVDRIAGRHRTTRDAVVLAGYGALVHRLSLQDDLTIGLSITWPAGPDSGNLMGCFSTTLPLRVDLSSAPSFTRLLTTTTADLLTALTWRQLPEDETPDEPLRVRFVIEDTRPAPRLRLPGTSVEQVAAEPVLTESDVTFRPGWNEGAIEYREDVLDAIWARSFLSSLEHLLADAGDRPDAPVTELRLLSAAAARAAVEAAREGVEDYGRGETAHGLFEAQVARAPEAPAVEGGGVCLTYAELNERADRLARLLQGRGAGPETLIAVCIDRSVAMIVAILAVLKSGAAFVPLDPGFPPERMARICDDASPLLILTEDRHRSLLDGSPVALLDVGEPDPESLPPAKREVAVGNLACVYYTSGSTGAPKGVLLDHACVMNRLQWLRRRYPLEAGDAVLHKTPLIFDVAILEIFLPLMAGATLVLADPRSQADVVHLGELLRTRPIVLAHFIPSMLDAYLDHAAPAAYPALKWVLMSGEAVPPGLSERFHRHFSAELHNHYGQTETSEVAAWEGGLRTGGGPVPIGRQVGIYRLHVLDPALQPVPAGTPGELYVAGVDGLARGYNRQAGQTAARFLPDPYAPRPGQRFYRTGDLVRLGVHGQLEHLGRTDQQAKIRGARVEVAEVEDALGRHPSVRACAVVVRTDDHGEKRLVAYVVGELDAMGLAAHAQRLLPAFMVPAVYVALPKLPRTASGKIDRRSLPPPRAGDYAAGGPGRPSVTPLEAEVAAVWAEILQLPAVGRDDDFFGIGGHSLRAIQLLFAISERFGVEIPVRDFFVAPTVESLAAMISEARASEPPG